ncbi:glycosyl transferase [Candidatus Kuenenbacteria bacterium CG23_combo_of_CG06-09_8_20_14_all_36_9]|uniref:Glycosyltransferase family 2 protein n=1 Tax=Candidatus Kuenenbacteria bacterium CG10_big_fil_rev_8_21_14_0_10_36_11 TaxID=1974618 RepID=A0A2M6WA79_9BACT|nr:MAG: glycosyl transferase [Candidatus Kuenenbacteria bacterium CG23_combo_of_CG06-09_8_20_14_all_36_9]PIT89722.1 MAG: glycosyltransferase family 2 protein [Candidatus Kuenenbacteria bacterium CG10_big_fil_rev_8_21_14_0_10_36_11]
MNIQDNNIFIILPAFNEAQNISATLNDLLKYNYQIIVVDDGSKDNTSELAKKFPVKILRHEINRGQGAALATGTIYALKNGAEIIAHFDADGQFLAEEISLLIEPIIKDQADIVLGTRFHTNQKISTNSKMPWLKRKIIHPCARFLNYFFTGLKLTDVHCGLRAMNRLAAEKIQIYQDGMAHNTEIVAQIKKQHLRYQEIPATVIYKKFGQGIGGGIRILKELIISKIIN